MAAEKVNVHCVMIIIIRMISSFLVCVVPFCQFYSCIYNLHHNSIRYDAQKAVGLCLLREGVGIVTKCRHWAHCFPAVINRHVEDDLFEKNGEVGITSELHAWTFFKEYWILAAVIILAMGSGRMMGIQHKKP